MNEELKTYHVNVDVLDTRTLRIDVLSNDKESAIRQAVDRYAESLKFEGTIYTPKVMRVVKKGSLTTTTDLQDGTEVSWEPFTTGPVKVGIYRIIDGLRDGGLMALGGLVGFGAGVGMILLLGAGR